MPPKPIYVQVGLTSELGYLFTWVVFTPDIKMGATLTLADFRSVWTIPVWTIRWIGEARLEKPPRKGWKVKVLVRKDGAAEPIPSFNP